MSAITLNGNLLSNAMAIENNSYNNYDNSQRYEKDNSDKYRTDSYQQSNNEDNYGYDDKNIPPEIFPVNKVSELGDEWWQWIASLNNITDANPFTDLGQDGCDVGLQDNGKLLFLVGSVKDPETGFVEHECGVKQGTAILFPIVNVVCDDLEGPPFFGANETEQRICANNLMDNASALHANIDGFKVIDPEQYRIDSPAGGFEFTAVLGNPVSIPPGNGTGVSDGFWILLKPFKPGEHTISFSGNITFADGSVSEIGATYFLDVHKAEKSYDSNNYPQNYSTADYPQKYPTADYPQKYPTADYPQKYPTADYPQKYPTADYPQKYPTDDYPQKYPTDDYPQKYPTDDYPQKYPTDDYPQKYPTDDYPQKYPTDDYPQKYPTDDYPTKLY